MMNMLLSPIMNKVEGIKNKIEDISFNHTYWEFNMKANNDQRNPW
jgi:hypothetical protein